MHPLKKYGESSVNLLGLGVVVRMVPHIRPITRKDKTMNTPSTKSSKAELVVIQGFECEDIDVSIEELELKIMPESAAGFLD